MYMIDYWDEVDGCQKTRPATQEEITEIEERKDTVVVPQVTQEVTMRQARLALRAAGYLSSIEPAIAQLSSPEREDAQIEWEYAATVKRSQPLTAYLAQTIGITDEELDQLFTHAATL